MAQPFRCGYSVGEKFQEGYTRNLLIKMLELIIPVQGQKPIHTSPIPSKMIPEAFSAGKLQDLAM
jgi:hypothetical protein